MKIVIFLFLHTFFMCPSFAESFMQFNSEEEKKEYIAISMGKSFRQESDNLFIGEIISAKQSEQRHELYDIGIIELKVKVLKQDKGIFNNKIQFLYRYGNCSNFSYGTGESNCNEITEKNKNVFLIASKIEKGGTNLMGKNKLLSMSPISRPGNNTILYVFLGTIIGIFIIFKFKK